MMSRNWTPHLTLRRRASRTSLAPSNQRSEEHTSELQSQSNLVCRLLLEKKKKRTHLLHCPPRPQRQPDHAGPTPPPLQARTPHASRRESLPSHIHRHHTHLID